MHHKVEFTPVSVSAVVWGALAKKNLLETSKLYK